MLRGVGVQFGRELIVLWLLPAGLAIAALVVTRRARRSTRTIVVTCVRLLVLAYLVGVIALTLWPFDFDIEAGRITDRGNWAPFGGTLGFLISDNSLKVQVASRDFLANVLLFAPLGVLLAARQKRSTGVLLVALLLIGMAFALEVIQGLTVAERTLDIDDAIAGSIGAVLATAVGGMMRPLVDSRHTALRSRVASGVG